MFNVMIMTYICSMQLIYKLLFLTGLVAVLVFLIRRMAKAGVRSIERWEERQKIKANPYILYHKRKMQNDSNYDQYMDWLEKEGHGAPIKKVISPEDAEADEKIKRLIL